MKNYEFTLNWQPIEQVSPKVTTSSLDTFLADTATDSVSQYFDIQSSRTESDLAIVAPSQWKISLDNSTWVDSLTVSNIGGIISSVRIYVKLLKGTDGVYSGIISNTISGAIHNISVSGVISVYVTPIKYGSLYNWPVATDVRGIANGDFNVPTDAQFTTLVTYLGGASVAGGKLKEMGLTYWTTPNTGATNETGFNGRGSGYRDAGGFQDKNASLCLLSSTNNGTNYSWGVIINSGIEISLGITGYLSDGTAVRLVRAATEAEQLQADGSACTPYIGNDFKVYRTVKIGTQVWTADNLAETLFATGYSDWYLPSKDELNAMYTELHLEGVGEFKDSYYWSSSEYSASNAWLQDYEIGLQSNFGKDYVLYVRPVRSFESTLIYELREYIGGGLVFHITDLGGGNYKYYIAAPEDYYGTLEWGALGVEVSGTGTAIGTGEANTALIIATLEAIPETGKAAQYCDEYDSQVIPTVTDNGEWAALTTGARCAYNNDESNVLL